MSERKVINKYYPPDFDPAKIPRARKPKNNQVTVRMMMPMSVRCNTCGEYIYKGKKFNSKKETVVGEEYLTVKIFRFYMRCPNCSTEFTIKTDPENSDYTADMNCSRNFEPWRDREKQIEDIKKQREKEEEGDAMKALENRTMDSKVEMDIIEALDEIRSLNARNAKIDTDTLLDMHKQTFDEHQKELDDEEARELQSVVFKNSTNYVKRISESNSEEPPLKRVKEEDGETSKKISVASISFLPPPKKRKESEKPQIVQFKPKIAAVATKSKEPKISLVDY